MAVTDIKKIDGIAKNNKELVLLITDHLDWSEEYKHLQILQNKINSYLEFIESRQYVEIYPDNFFEHYVIEIHFKNGISENGLAFLEVVANQVEEIKVKVRIELEENRGSDGKEN